MIICCSTVSILRITLFCVLILGRHRHFARRMFIIQGAALCDTAPAFLYTLCYSLPYPPTCHYALCSVCHCLMPSSTHCSSFPQLSSLPLNSVLHFVTSSSLLLHRVLFAGQHVQHGGKATLSVPHLCVGHRVTGISNGRAGTLPHWCDQQGYCSGPALWRHQLPAQPVRCSYC